MDIVPNEAGKVARCLDGLGLLLHHIDRLLSETLVLLHQVLALVLAECDAADILRVLLEPVGDGLIWHALAHLLVDGLDERATADVAPSQDWGEFSHLLADLLV